MPQCIWNRVSPAAVITRRRQAVELRAGTSGL